MLLLLNHQLMTCYKLSLLEEEKDSLLQLCGEIFLQLLVMKYLLSRSFVLMFSYLFSLDFCLLEIDYLTSLKMRELKENTTLALCTPWYSIPSYGCNCAMKSMQEDSIIVRCLFTLFNYTKIGMPLVDSSQTSYSCLLFLDLQLHKESLLGNYI